ncbi:MAG: hypothetical protein WBK51_12460 [Polaromonas sp.]
MKINQQLTITGMKSSKGEYEGAVYDSTKVYAMTDMDETKGNAKGFATVEYSFAKADEFEKYKHLPFPFKADCEMEFVTSGKAQKMILLSIKPVAAATAVKV